MRVREVEQGTFSPLVFSTTGGMGNTATVVYKRIASLIADKQSKPYSKTLHWLRCRCRQAHSPSATMEVACAEGRVPSYTYLQTLHAKQH